MSANDNISFAKVTYDEESVGLSIVFQRHRETSSLKAQQKRVGGGS